MSRGRLRQAHRVPTRRPPWQAQKVNQHEVRHPPQPRHSLLHVRLQRVGMRADELHFEGAFQDVERPFSLLFRSWPLSGRPLGHLGPVWQLLTSFWAARVLGTVAELARMRLWIYIYIY